MAYPITRQFGPNAKGSELTFSDMDENLLYLDSKVTGSDSYVPIYSGSKSLTSSIIYQNNGKIGIGTTSSYSIFNVVGLTTIGYPGVNSNSYIQFWPNIAGESAYYITDSGSVLRIGTGEKASSGTDVINVASTNVGIGKDDPQAKLDINGNTIITGSLRITAGITGSLLGTSSYATTASYSLISTTSSYSSTSTSASYALNAVTSITSSYSSTTFINRPTVSSSRSTPHIRLDYTGSSGLAIDNPIGIISSYVPEYSQPASYIKFVSQGSWSGGTYPSGIEFYTSQQTGGAEKLTLSLNQNGVIEFNNYTSNGTVTTTGGTGTISVSSDRNLKTADGFVENGIEKVMALKPRYFYWKQYTGFGNARQLGFYAQEVNSVSEEAANTPVAGQQWGIYDRALIAILTKAVQEQQAQIEALQKQVNTLISGSK